MDGKIDYVELDGYGKLLDQVMWLKKNLWGICLFSSHFSDFCFFGGGGGVISNHVFRKFNGKFEFRV